VDAPVIRTAVDQDVTHRPDVSLCGGMPWIEVEKASDAAHGD
jgi:hypothetical protein